MRPAGIVVTRAIAASLVLVLAACDAADASSPAVDGSGGTGGRDRGADAPPGRAGGGSSTYVASLPCFEFARCTRTCSHALDTRAMNLACNAALGESPVCVCDGVAVPQADASAGCPDAACERGSFTHCLFERYGSFDAWFDRDLSEDAEMCAAFVACVDRLGQRELMESVLEVGRLSCDPDGGSAGSSGAGGAAGAGGRGGAAGALGGGGRDGGSPEGGPDGSGQGGAGGG